MTGFIPLLKKEIKEQLRTYRLLIVGGVFVFFGITTPLLLKYLPEIIGLSGQQIPIEMPPPTAIQSLNEYAGTIGQLGILVAVLVAMGGIASEVRRSTAVMILSKPVSYIAFVNAKFVAMSLTFLVSLTIASLFCFAYTAWLIGNASVVAYVGMNLLLGLFLMFCLALTLLCSTVFKSSVAAGGLAMAILVAQAVLASLPVIGDYFPGKLLAWGTYILEARGINYWWALGITIVVTGTCLIASQRILRNKEL
jgi:ABC-2 type transport system permease protein